MMEVTKRRLYKDLQNIISDNYDGITASPIEDNLMVYYNF